MVLPEAFDGLMYFSDLEEFMLAPTYSDELPTNSK